MNMNFNFNSIHKYLWIIVALILYFLVDLDLWQIIVVMVMLAVIFKLINNHQMISENFEQCTNCDNPYFIKSFAEIHDQSLIGKQKPIAIAISGKPPVPISQQLQEWEKTNKIQSIEPPTTVEIEQPTEVKIISISANGTETKKEKMSICMALKKAGFDPQWTYDDVNQLLKTPEGSQRIQQINADVIKMSQIKKLTNQNITKCYPRYITEYVCQKPKTQSPTPPPSPSSCPNNQQIDQLNEKIKKQEQQIQSLTNKEKIPQPPITSPEPSIEPSITSIQLQNQVMNDTINTLSESAIEKYVNKNCNLEDIKKSINVEVENFYGSSYDKIKKQDPSIPPKQLQQIKMQYLNLTDIVKRKAILEFIQLISFYQAYKQDKWKTDLLLRKTNSIRGQLVPGTDFYIPWTIFDKNEKCFGSQ